MVRKIALLIGVSEYGEGIPSLSAPPNDAIAMERVLNNPDLGRFNEVETLIDPDLIAMQTAIHRLFGDRAKDDLVLLFFSGHGITDDSNRLYFATKGTSKNAYKATSVAASFVQDVSRESYAKRQAIVLDCCYSGAFAEGWQAKSTGLDLERELGAEGRVVLTSSTATQTSFQQEGAMLSLYTKYLVEGMETGAADRDGDGKIHARELHEYAKGKVQEVKPKQKPAIISDREGYNILLSHACLGNPEWDFRKSVEKYIYEGKITKIGDGILKIQCQKLGIDRERAKEIIDEVLAPYRQRLENIEHYREILQEAIEQDCKLDERQQRELKDLQDILGLEDKDIEGVKEQVSNNILKSEKGIDYTKLRDFLAAGQWKEADEETDRIMLQAADRTEQGWLDVADIDRFPCKDLRTIDRLWSDYSKGKFGFSVQKKIYQELGGMREYNRKVWKEFGDRIGWRKGGKWLRDSNLTFDVENATCAHLPGVGSYWWCGSDLFSRAETCNL